MATKMKFIVEKGRYLIEPFFFKIYLTQKAGSGLPGTSLAVPKKS